MKVTFLQNMTKLVRCWSKNPFEIVFKW